MPREKRGRKGQETISRVAACELPVGMVFEEFNRVYWIFKQRKSVAGRGHKCHPFFYILGSEFDTEISNAWRFPRRINKRPAGCGDPGVMNCYCPIWTQRKTFHVNIVSGRCKFHGIAEATASHSDNRRLT